MASWWKLLFNLPDEREEKGMSSLDLWKEVYGGRDSKTGQPVTVQTALEATAVLACVRAIAEGVAQSKIKFYTASDRPQRIRSHPVLDLLTWKPNELQTAFGFIETVLIHAALTGNAFVFVNRVGSKRVPRELIPLQPGNVTVEQMPDMSLRYTVRDAKGASMVIPSESIWHLRGPSWNGWLGMEAVKLAREAIGLATATEAKHASMHKNTPDLGGVYSVEGKLTEPQFKMLRDWIVRNTTGDLAGSPLILDNGAKWLSQQMKGVDAQHLETRKFQVEEICRAFRVIPMMAGYSDKTATYASAEQMFIAHVVHTLTPWATRLEQSAERNLLADDEEIDIRFDMRSLMRGSAADRAEYISKALGSGGSQAWMRIDEAREEDSLEWMDGTDRLPEPTNVAPVPPDTSAADAARADETAKALAAIETKSAERNTELVAAIKSMPGPEVHVTTPAVTVNAAPINVTVPVTQPKRGTVTKTVTAFDAEGRIAEMQETEADA
jgi:HK97 family phage portal protein